MLSVRVAAVLWLCFALHIATMTTALLYQFLAKFTITITALPKNFGKVLAVVCYVRV